MKLFFSITICLLAIAGNAMANDDCIKKYDSADSRLAMIYDEAIEYFTFGKYLEAELSLHQAFMPQGCGKPMIINIKNVDETLRQQIILLYALTLWEKGDHFRLTGFAETYLDKPSNDAWRCRVHLYEKNYEKSAECFYQVGEVQRYQRDYRASQISKQIGRQLN